VNRVKAIPLCGFNLLSSSAAHGFIWLATKKSLTLIPVIAQLLLYADKTEERKNFDLLLF